MKNPFKAFICTISLLPLISLVTKAQTDGIVLASASVAPAPEQMIQLSAPKEEENNNNIEGKLSVSGYFDTYYFANLNNPSTRNNLGASGISRGFDRYPGQFQLGMFMTRTAYNYKNTEMVGEIGYGPNVEYGSYGNDFRYKWGTIIANSTYSAIMIKQAYITTKASEKLSFTMGQFGTHIGYEMIDAPLNFHYSINNTFNAGIPFYHLGVKANYSATEKIGLMAGLVNGTDNINDNNRGKSFIGQLSWLPTENLSIYFNTIQGNEANARATGKDTASYFGVLDLVANYKLSDRWSITYWGMRGTLRGEFQGSGYDAKSKHWFGSSVYLTYIISNTVSIGTRIEYFDNRDGARSLLTHGKGTDAETLTLTAKFSLADDRLQIKPEFRIDHFRKITSSNGEDALQQFADQNGNFTKTNQATLGVAAIYKF